MSENLVAQMRDMLDASFVRRASRFLDASESVTQMALQGVVPAVVATLARNGVSTEGAARLMSIMTAAHLDTGFVENPGALFNDDAVTAGELLQCGTGTLVPALFGDRAGYVATTLSSTWGLDRPRACKLLALVAPLALGLLKKRVVDRRLRAAELSSLLRAQAPHLQPALDDPMAKALGFQDASHLVRDLSCDVHEHAAAPRGPAGERVSSPTSVGVQ